MKACTKCGELKDDSAFGPKKKGLSSWCKSCCSAASREHYARNRERLLSRLSNKRAEQISALPERVCACCGVAFKPPSKQSKFCSAVCRQRTSRRKYRAKVAAQNRAALRSYMVECDVCGTEFLRGSYQQARCSPECAEEHNRRHRVEVHAATYKPKRESAVSRTCTECGARFTPRDARQMGCSVECGQKRSARIGNKKRRAALNGQAAEAVDPLEIFNRDNWHCCACSKPTPKSLRGTNLPDSPELDHIVPVTRGGWHKPDNLRLLCRACNMSKGARLDSEWKGKAAPTLALF